MSFMSIVMVYFLFMMIFFHTQECAVIRLNHHNRNILEYIIQKYTNPLRRLSADLPNHAIEMQIEIHGSLPREVTSDPRRFVRPVNLRQPKPILRAQDEAEGVAVPANGTTATVVASVPEQATAAPVTPVVRTGVATELSTLATAAGPDPGQPDQQKIPVFMADLKKALDDLEKKLIFSSENSTTVTTSGTPITEGTTPLVPNKPVQAIEDIVQLLKKAIHIEHRKPKPGDEKLEWVQIKIPKSMQL